MAVRAMRLFGDPILRSRAAEVTDFDKELRRLIKDLYDTLDDQDGAGLAAPQIGVGLRVFAYHVDDSGPHHVVNPVITELGEEEQDGDEGCLSIPGLYFDTVRKARAVVTGFTSSGDPITVDAGEDLLMARCFQHETDHLDGVLFIDRLDPDGRKAAMRAIRDAEWFGEPTPTVKYSPHPTHGLGL